MDKMTASATSKKAASTTGANIHVVPSSGTLQLPIKYVLIGSTIAVPASVVVAEAEALIREAHKIGGDYSEEELEWKAFFADTHVQAELERLAEEAEREFAAGETEEGGFAIE